MFKRLLCIVSIATLLCTQTVFCNSNGVTVEGREIKISYTLSLKNSFNFDEAPVSQTPYYPLEISLILMSADNANSGNTSFDKVLYFDQTFLEDGETHNFNFDFLMPNGNYKYIITSPLGVLKTAVFYNIKI